MIVNIRTGVLVLCSLLVLSGCIKIQLKPEKLMNDTVSAGKSLYETVKQKKDGTEERLYTHTLELNPELEEQALAAGCLNHLKSLAESSTENKMRVLEESTEIVNTEPIAKLKCTLRAVV